MAQSAVSPCLVRSECSLLLLAVRGGCLIRERGWGRGRGGDRCEGGGGGRERGRERGRVTKRETKLEKGDRERGR